MKKILVAMLIISLFFINTYSIPICADSLDPKFNTLQLTPIMGRPLEHRNVKNPLSESNRNEKSPTSENTAPKTGATTPEAVSVTLSFAGDCTIGDDENYAWNTFDEVYKQVKDPAYFFRGVNSIFAYDDFTMINFEGTFTNETKKAVKLYCFKGDPSYIDVLLKGSIEGVTLANNHSLDYLQKGFDDTVKTLNDAGIMYAYFDTYFIKDIKGMQIGFLGYKGWEHESRSNALLVKHVKEMREKGVDFIIASYHWGDQNSYTPNTLQKRMAHFAIDNGVDLVIGHHPHVLQGMETYKGKNIVYSLGNFCFGGAPNPRDKDTAIYQHILNFDVLEQKIISSENKIIPARVSSEKGRNNYQPIIATGDEEKRILQKYAEISSCFN
jgi:poly-gamma-glutamate synthesis protein (capsule biosynthesis protein)